MIIIIQKYKVLTQSIHTNRNVKYYQVIRTNIKVIIFFLIIDIQVISNNISGLKSTLIIRRCNL